MSKKNNINYSKSFKNCIDDFEYPISLNFIISHGSKPISVDIDLQTNFDTIVCTLKDKLLYYKGTNNIHVKKKNTKVTNNEDDECDDEDSLNNYCNYRDINMNIDIQLYNITTNYYYKLNTPISKYIEKFSLYNEDDIFMEIIIPEFIIKNKYFCFPIKNQIIQQPNHNAYFAWDDN